MLGTILALIGGTIASSLIGYGLDKASANSKERQKQLENENNLNITNEWKQFIEGGDRTGQEMIDFAMANKDWAKENGDFLNPLIESQLRRDNMSKDLQAQMSAYKENGINPLNVVGNIGSLGTSQVDIQNAQTSNDSTQPDLGGSLLKDLKDLLMVTLLFKRMGKG